MGIDSKIADFFANERPVPVNNRFWERKRIYLSAGFGFLTIPFVFDLMYKAGIPREVLLDHQHVNLMEQGFDRLKRYELGELSREQFIQECMSLLEGRIRQQHLAVDLAAVLTGAPARYFSFETTYPALARSDFFLFTLVDLDISDEWVQRFLPYWYSIARPILLLDDFKDLVQDRLLKEENTIIELGNDKAAIEAAFQLGLSDASYLGALNPLLAKRVEGYLNEAMMLRHIREILEG